MRLDEFERHPLLFGPSPVHRLERLTDYLGGAALWAKRDDCNSGLAYGGNKTRKLEYLVADALAQGCDTPVSTRASICRSPARRDSREVPDGSRNGWRPTATPARRGRPIPRGPSAAVSTAEAGGDTGNRFRQAPGEAEAPKPFSWTNLRMRTGEARGPRTERVAASQMRAGAHLQFHSAIPLL